MSKPEKRPRNLFFLGLTNLFLLILGTIEVSIILPRNAENALADVLNYQENTLKSSDSLPKIEIIQENTLLPTSPTTIDKKKLPVSKRLLVILTGYSSSIFETDDTPFITASGSYVKEGVVANNLLPFGTKIKIPEIFGDKVFVVEDRMSDTKGSYHVDIWFPSREEALNFGAKKAYIEILSE